MCYAIPGKVKSVQGKWAYIDYFGEEKKAYNEFYDLAPGQYIYAQGGFVIEKIGSKEAREILKTWKELFFELRNKDEQLIAESSAGITSDAPVRRLLDKALGGAELTKSELNTLMGLDKKEDMESLFNAANLIRAKFHKNSCCVHGIIEISNICTRNCAYCGISLDVKKINRYRMTPQEIFEAAHEAVGKYGFKALVLQSGENCGYTVEELAGIVKKIKEHDNVLIFVSFGEAGEEGLKKLYEAGARGLLLRFETSNPGIYEKLHPGYKLEDRLENIRKAYDIGYLIITGSLIGLPGQTHADLVGDILLAKSLHTEMYTFGPFLPSPGTILERTKRPDEIDVLKTIALTRIADGENAKILVTTGFETLSKSAREKGLTSGANSVMINATPAAFKKDYAIYPKRAHSNESLSDQIKDTLELLKGLGRAPTDLGI